ncbi:restriction endonuclease subunit S [Mycoplasma sp. Ms02]|uniref:restriction endonuclease subunit S n=1 Tax=Mycoplasma sp. Ms02 TaxID=353851 RepID=UPI001C896CB7|nr:restriction endonuclease subunit S [Mycoplasma sp. Ms02]QZE12502.1 restriction endonuclease subunit S [Mycoplasma sp. Ms02]
MPGKSYEKFMKSEGLYELTKMITVGFDGNFVHSNLYVDQADWLLQKNDLVMMVNEQGVGEHLGRVVLVPEDNTYVLNGTVGSLRPNKDIDPFFLKYNINNNQYYFKNNRLGTSILYVRRSTIEKMSSLIPRFEEQRKLGNFFNVHELKLERLEYKIKKLKLLKQTLLAKIFINNNYQLPSFRFKDFQDEWTWKSWSEIVEKVSKNSNDNTLPKLEYEDIDKGKGILNKDISNKFDDRKGILFEPGDVLFGKLRPYLKNWWLADFIGIALGNFWVMKPLNNDSNFVFNLLQTNRFKEVSNLTFGTKMPSSDWSLVSEQTFAIPTTSEQTKIGKLFQLLDTLINLQSKEINILKELKKTAMKMMLI